MTRTITNPADGSALDASVMRNELQLLENEIGTINAVSGVLKSNGTTVSAAINSDLPAMTATVGGAVPTPPNDTSKFLRGDGTFATPAGGGTVTAVSVASANGFAGSSSGGATPALTISTSVTGVLKGNGTAISAATADSDYTTPTGTETMTNKRITRRVVAVTQSATPTINTDNTDVAYITGLAQAVTSFTTNLSGTPVNGDMLIIDITDSGTGRALTFGASFEASGTVALPTTTVASTKLTIGFRWNTATSKWTCVAVA